MNSLLSPFAGKQIDRLGQPHRNERLLRVLLVEDNEDDAALIRRLLRRAGYALEWERVQTAEALEAALAHRTWDIVLSDYNLPQFDALQALRTLRGHLTHLPFIIISGSIGEETAVAAMRAGANDYVMKTNLPRLVPAVERELRDAAERQEKAHAQKALLDLQEKFQTVFHESLDVMVVLDANGLIRHVNRAVTRTLGYDERRLLGEPFAMFWPARESSAVETLLNRVQDKGSVFYSGPFRRLDGSTCPMDLQANRVPWGNEEAVIVTLRDVSDRQRAEQRLADEKEQLTVTLRSMGDGVITTDVAGKVVLLNGAAEELTGWKQTEAREKSLGEVLLLQSDEEEASGGDFWRQVLKTGEAISLHRQVLKDRAGQRRTLALKAAPIASHDGSHSGVVTVFRDITLEHKVEEELQKASKLESVALMAGGIAHDFNNMLTAILGHLSLAKVTDVPPREVLATVEKACLYATDLTRQLMTFAKGSDPVRRLANVAEIVDEGVRFALHGTNMRCRFDLARDLPPVELDRGQINQVINNLVINAVQASPDGGILHVEARRMEVGKEERIATLKAGAYVRLSIRDQGSGISPENVARIFDPYFTTKATGSGLGLATSYSIIKKHGGLIRVESELGVGTTFMIYLPASQTPGVNAAASAQPPAGNVREPVPGGRRVLFMDDEEILQELVSAMLAHLGYEVVCAAHGEEAIERYTAAHAAGRPFDAVIVDLTVPGGMGGHETVRQLQKFDPQIRAVVSSGYSNDPIMAEFERHGFAGVIAKPYQMAELSNVLEGVMRTPTP